MQIAVVSVLNFLSNPNTGEPLNLKDALCLFCGKVSRSTLCAEVLHQNFMRSYIFQVKHHWNMVTFTCCIAHPNAANTHFSHTKWNETNHYSQVSVVMRHNDSSRQGKKRNQFYWSAICGTNSTATLPSCLMDSQIPGMSWHPVAINSMHHFNCSENYAPTASTVNVPKTWMKHEYSVHIAMKRYGFWRVKGYCTSLRFWGFLCRLTKCECFMRFMTARLKIWFV